MNELHGRSRQALKAKMLPAPNLINLAVLAAGYLPVARCSIVTSNRIEYLEPCRDVTVRAVLVKSAEKD